MLSAMSPRKRTTTLALGGAAALAFGAYTLGTQAGGGSADAAKARAGAAQSCGPKAHGRRFGGPRFGGFSDLASRLGVDPAKLRTALDELRAAEPKSDPEAGLADALATELKLDPAKVKDALAKLRTQHDQQRQARANAFADALAKELNVDPAKVRDAIAKREAGEAQAGGPPPGGPEGPGERHGGRAGGPGPDLSALAGDIGVTPQALSDALQKVRLNLAPGARGDHGARGDELATALGVDPGALRAAMQKLADQRRADFAAKLAGKLGLDPAKVADALKAGGPMDGPGGHFH
jgi:transcriptional regulator with XRE-family HTH domain